MSNRIWVNGTFDVVHVGHIRLLKAASLLGEVRVGLDTDERVKMFKGESRPINNIGNRIELMSSIKYVDSVVSFSSDEELRSSIKEWGSDIIFIGSDYKDRSVIGSDLVKEVIFFDKINGYSSTIIIGKK
jgi:D-beta-D-heptose 7-phosphate kinase/D-beta-D-heptose 1-phosphate adenosyltransferase